MTFTTKLLAGAAGIAAFAAAPPAGAQYYGYQGNSYGAPYGNTYGYGVNTNVAAQQCTAAVQQRLYNRTSIGGILGAVLGANTQRPVLSLRKFAARQWVCPRAWPRQQRPLCLQRLRPVRCRRLRRAGLRL